MGYNEPSKLPAGRKAADVISERFTWVMSSLVGREAECYMKNGARIRGIFHSYDANGISGHRGKQFCLLNAQELAQGDKPSGEIQAKLIISGEDVMSIDAYNVPLTYTEEDLEREKKAQGVSVEASGPKEVYPRPERELQRWLCEDSTATQEPLESYATPDVSAWNQFEVNERIFGLVSTYNENIYTTTLNRSEISPADQAKAALQAEDIENDKRQSLSDYSGSDHEGDEEAKFSAVIHTPLMVDSGKLRLESKTSGALYSRGLDKRMGVDKSLYGKAKPPLESKNELDSRVMGATKAMKSSNGTSPRLQTQKNRERIVESNIDALGLDPPAVPINPQDASQMKDRLLGNPEAIKDPKKSFREDSDLFTKKLRGKVMERNNGKSVKQDVVNANMSEPLVDALQSTATSQPPMVHTTGRSSQLRGSASYLNGAVSGPPYSPSLSVSQESARRGCFSSPQAYAYATNTANRATKGSRPWVMKELQEACDETASSVDKPLLSSFQFNPYAPAFVSRAVTGDASAEERMVVGAATIAANAHTMDTSPHGTVDSPSSSSPHYYPPVSATRSGGHASPIDPTLPSMNTAAVASPPVVAQSVDPLPSTPYVAHTTEPMVTPLAAHPPTLPKRLPPYSVHPMGGPHAPAYYPHPDVAIYANPEGVPYIQEGYVPYGYVEQTMDPSHTFFQQPVPQPADATLTDVKFFEKLREERRSLKESLSELIAEVKNESTSDAPVEWSHLGDKDAMQLLNDYLHSSDIQTVITHPPHYVSVDHAVYPDSGYPLHSGGNAGILQPYVPSTHPPPHPRNYAAGLSSAHIASSATPQPNAAPHPLYNQTLAPVAFVQRPNSNTVGSMIPNGPNGATVSTPQNPPDLGYPASYVPNIRYQRVEYPFAMSQNPRSPVSNSNYAHPQSPKSQLRMNQIIPGAFPQIEYVPTVPHGAPMPSSLVQMLPAAPRAFSGYGASNLSAHGGNAAVVNASSGGFAASGAYGNAPLHYAHQGNPVMVPTAPHFPVPTVMVGSKFQAPQQLQSFQPY